MKVYCVFFSIRYDSSTLEGVFSTREIARRQVELAKEAYSKYDSYQWVERFEDTWDMSDLTLEIKELTVDELSYEST